MKKIIFTFFSLLFLVGCGNQATLSIEFDSQAVDVVVIEFEEFLTLWESDQDFILYISSETCQSCIEFKPILKSVIEETHLVIYQIEAQAPFSPDNLYVKYSATPTIALISKQKVRKSFNPISNANVFSSKESFTKTLETYIVMQ